MNAVIKYTFCLLIPVMFTFLASGQKASDRLKKEQQRLEQQIATTKSLVEASRKNTKNSLEEVQLIEKQVRFREQLLSNIDNQIRASELKIEQKTQRISQLEAEVIKLKKQYADLLLYAYKKRNKYGNLLYIFSAASVEEALKRKLYLEKLAEIQKKQFRLIQQNKELLAQEIEEIEVEREKKLVLADQKRVERQEILRDKQEKEKIYQAYKAKEQEALAELRLQEEKNAQLQQEIQSAIQAEIAAEQARLEKQRKEAEARRRAEQAKNTSTTVPEKGDDTPIFVVTKETELAGADFASNRGKLPWPVEKGAITQDYGKHPHPTLPNVFTQNNGVDISTPKNAVVQAIYDGEVTSVINIPGAGKVVIVKHGNYRSVYSNIQEAYVTKGTAVSTKTPLGALLPNKDGNVSIAHFEIHEVNNGQVKQLNPNLWIAK